jgi:predicted negative regulator of RcsB-dependent stress response
LVDMSQPLRHLAAPRASRLALVASVTALVACHAAGSPPPAGPSHAAVAAAVTEPAAVPFFEDDYGKALAEAKAKGLPLFVDAWAPWCHTCLSMRSYVFTDRAVRAHAGEFVWLAIDTEKAENDAFVEKFAMQAWPTLWVIDPRTEKATMRWLGSATAPELVSLLEDARVAVTRGDGSGDASAHMLRGNRAVAEGKKNEAIDAYRAALASAPANWEKRPRVVEALGATLAEAKDNEACVDLATRELPSLPLGTSRVNTLLAGLGCASALPATSPKRAARAALLQGTLGMARDKSAVILADDRSGLFEAAVDALGDDKAEAERLAAAREWAAFLEAEAAHAPDAAARAVFDAHRVEAYLALGEPARALPMLEASAKDFPTDYNPHARLARVELEQKHFPKALAEVDLALAHVEGPRRLRVLVLKSDIQKASGDKKAARATLEEAASYATKVQLLGGYALYKTEIDKKKAALDPR